MKRLLCALAAWLLAVPVLAGAAGLQVEPVEYEIDGLAYESLLIHSGEGAAARPGLVMVPNWMGISEGSIELAREIAGQRYVVLLADMYGKSVRPADGREAAAAAGSVLGDRVVARERINRAVQALTDSAGERLQGGKVAAIGFCFGGTTVLELARSGADVAAVVALHGNPSPVMPIDDAGIQSAVLVLHGADDSAVPEQGLREFEQEMRTAGVDWTLVSFGGAVHCFAEPSANSPPNCLYHPTVAKRSFGIMHGFLAEHFDRR